jgi:ribosomal protein S27E
MSEFTWTDPRIPEPEQRFLFVRCPRCGYRVWNQLFSQAIAYQAHYLGHILADLAGSADD